MNSKHIRPLQINLPSPFRRGYTWRSSLYATLIAVGIRIALLAGRVVVLVGPCRSGKSVILKRTLPGRIIDKRREAIQASHRPGLTPAELPAGPFAIDDLGMLDPLPVEACLRDAVNRPYILTTYRHEVLQRAGIEEVIATRERIEITLTW